jgi:hypothetical protein
MERYQGLTNLTMGAEERPLFPCEIAHGKHIFQGLEWMKTVPIHSVRELKRFVKSKRTDTFGQRVSLEVLVGLAHVTRVLKETTESLTAYVGDLELGGAFRHIKLLSMDVAIIEDTNPNLSNNDLFYQMYIKREKVLPFAILLPGKMEDVCAKEETLTELLESNKPVSTSIRKLLRASM